MIVNDFDSLPRDAQEAAFSHMQHGGGSDSAAAVRASKRAEATGKGSDHRNAADLHKEAARGHRAEGDDEMAKAHTAAARSHDRKAKQTNNTFGRYPMGMTVSQRQEIVNELTTNCDCWKGAGDEKVLNAMTDEKLSQLLSHHENGQQAISVANSAANGFVDPSGTAYRVNPKTGKWEMKVVANAPAPAAPLPPPMRAKQRVPAPVPDDEDEPMDAEGEDDSDLEPSDSGQDVPVAPRRNKKAYNSRRPQTMEQYIRAAPPEVQNMIRAAQTVEQKEKDKIISQMLVNVADVDKRAQYDRLNRRSLDDLVNDLAMIPKQQSVEHLDSVNGSRLPLNGKRRQVANRGGSEDMLIPPTINWEEVNGEGKSAKNGQDPYAGVDNSGMEDDKSDDDYINSLPPHLRASVQNAIAIEARERRKLIDELTANVTDDDHEKRLRARLSGKSLEELKDLVALTPRREKPLTNYFGAASPSSGRQPIDNNQDDILIPTTIDWKENAASR